MADFHFLRPLWLLLLLTVPLLYLALKHKSSNDSGWGRLIPRTFLVPVIRRFGSAEQKTGSRWVPALSALIIFSFALAGPAWREAPTPLKKPGDSLVIVLDLSLSMLATDVEPDRLTRAKRKIRDILAVREGSLTGLVVYSGDAHVVTPLTDDSATLTGMLDVLDPTIMPAQGNRADLAISRARTLLERGAPGQGRILLLADDVSDRYQEAIHNSLSGTGISLSTLAVGTRDGGPIPLPRRGFIRDNDTIVITRARPDTLAEVARNNGGSSHEMTLDDSDIAALNLSPENSDEWQDTDSGLTINRWKDDGYWLLWLAAPLLLLGWRRGALTTLALTLLPAMPQPAAAMDWDSLWLREDQRAAELIRNDPAAAADQLETPEWRGAALYKAERYDEAARTLSESDTPLAAYNRGNALAKAGKLKEAIEAYDQALERNPDLDDARINRKIVEDLLKQQQQSSDQSQDSDQNQNQNQNQDQNQGSPQEPDQGSEAPGSGEQGDQTQEQNAGQKPDSGQEQSKQEKSEQDSAASTQNQETQTGRESGQAQAPAPTSETPLTQSQEQSLRRVPDNPGGLLQRKFLQQHHERQTPSDEGDTPW